MSREMKRTNVRLTDDDYNRIAMQAHRLGWSVNKFLVQSALSSSQAMDTEARAQALAEAQTVAVIDAITGLFKQAGDQANAREKLLRDQVRDAINYGMTQHGVPPEKLIKDHPDGGSVQ